MTSEGLENADFSEEDAAMVNSTRIRVGRNLSTSPNGEMWPAAYCSYMVCPVSSSATMLPMIPIIAARPLFNSTLSLRAFSSGSAMPVPK